MSGEQNRAIAAFDDRPREAIQRVPTRAERMLLRVTASIKGLVKRRIAQRAENRERTLSLLQEQQTRRQDPHAVDHLLAQMGLPRR